MLFRSVHALTNVMLNVTDTFSAHSSSRAGGGVLVDGVEVRVPQAIMEEAQAELAGRTGLTDSEPEDGDAEV